VRLENAGTVIEIVYRPEQLPVHLSSSFSMHFMTSPYTLMRGADAQNFHDLFMPLNNLAVEEFIDDSPSSLGIYGLDRPSRLLVEFGGGVFSVDLLIGDEINGMRYAKLANAPGVFTLWGLNDIINARPFDLVDKFALLININSVDELTISGGERPIRAEFQGEDEDLVFFLNGRKTEDMPFRRFYQAVISLMADAEYQPAPPYESGEITIEYRLNTPPGERVSITLIPYNRDFYVLRQEGTMEFLISRNQVRSIYEAMDRVVFE